MHPGKCLGAIPKSQEGFVALPLQVTAYLVAVLKGNLKSEVVILCTRSMGGTETKSWVES